MNESKPCTVCGGSGGIEAPPFATPDMHEYGGQVACPACDGTGLEPTQPTAKVCDCGKTPPHSPTDSWIHPAQPTPDAEETYVQITMEGFSPLILDPSETLDSMLKTLMGLDWRVEAPIKMKVGPIDMQCKAFEELQEWEG